MPAAFNRDDDVTTRYDLSGPFSQLPTTPITPDDEGFYEYLTTVGYQITDFHPSHRWVWNPFSGGVGEWWSDRHQFLQYLRRDNTTLPSNTLRPSGWNNNAGFSAYGGRATGYFSRIVNATCSSLTNFTNQTLLVDVEDDVTGNLRGTLEFEGADRGGETNVRVNQGLIFNEDRPPILRYQGPVTLDTFTVVLEVVTVFTPTFDINDI